MNIKKIIGKFNRAELVEFARQIYDKAVIDHYEDRLIDDEPSFELLIIDVLCTMGALKLWGEDEEDEPEKSEEGI